MTKKAPKMMRIASFMLQGIILGAIFLSPSIASASSKSNTEQISVRAITAVEAILDSAEQFLPEDGCDKPQLVNTFLPDILGDEPALEVLTTDALAVGISLRNVFYTVVTSKAP
jgi:hypothetical protein